MAGDYDRFVARIRQSLGIDLSSYKEAQMKRRLTSFYLNKGFANFSDFYEAIKANKKLQAEFLDRMTINVSAFFRNYDRWTVFETKILPRLLKNNERLKIWSAACSTGEEPYTIAMILAKYVPLSSISILATDIDEAALRTAKRGHYQERSLQEVPAAMKKQFFATQGEVHIIDKNLQHCVTFQKHNLLSDRFDTNFDLIVCRNVAIYFTEAAKEQLYKKISRALKKDGVLFVGSTEQILNPREYGLQKEETFFYRKC